VNEVSGKRNKKDFYIVPSPAVYCGGGWGWGKLQ